jgi:hypothetical protein
VVEALVTARVAREMTAKVLGVQKDRQGEFMQKVRAQQIDRMRLVFNRLSVNPESIEGAADTLLNTIVAASKDSAELLHYVSFQIANCVLQVTVFCVYLSMML